MAKSIVCYHLRECSEQCNTVVMNHAQHRISLQTQVRHANCSVPSVPNNVNWHQRCHSANGDDTNCVHVAPDNNDPQARLIT